MCSVLDSFSPLSLSLVLTFSPHIQCGVHAWISLKAGYVLYHTLGFITYSWIHRKFSPLLHSLLLLLLYTSPLLFSLLLSSCRNSSSRVCTSELIVSEYLQPSISSSSVEQRHEIVKKKVIVKLNLLGCKYKLMGYYNVVQYNSCILVVCKIEIITVCVTSVP